MTQEEKILVLQVFAEISKVLGKEHAESVQREDINTKGYQVAVGRSFGLVTAINRVDEVRRKFMEDE